MLSPTLPPKSTRIGVLCGGRSTERDVSLRSGANCLAALKRLGYTNSMLMDVGTDIAHALLSQGIEVAFLALHGKYGEDGCVQGLLECLDILYTGNGVLASAVGMDKTRTKALLAQAGLPVIQSVTLQASDSFEHRQALLEKVSVPVMVKPATGGSSVGMSKVTDLAELPAAIDAAFAMDTAVLIEPFVVGLDVTVGVIDTLVEGVVTPTVTPLLQLASKTKAGWYDLEAKYTHGLTEFILPARVSPTLTQAIQAATLAAHQALGCHGLSRTDFVVCPDQNRFCILETNTMPGMTDLSDLPFQANAMGIEYDALVAFILHSAYTRPSFASNITASPSSQPLASPLASPPSSPLESPLASAAL